MKNRFCLRAWLSLGMAALLFFCHGCSPFTITSPGPTPSGTVEYTDYTAEFRHRWCYRVLPTHLQPLYGALYAAVKECDTDATLTIRDADGNYDTFLGLKVTLPTPLTETADADTLFYAFTNDNPQFFFLGNTYSYEGYRTDDADYYDTFCLTCGMDAAARRTAASELTTAVDAMVAGIPSEADDYKTELYLHDALAAAVTYDDTVAVGGTAIESNPHAFPLMVRW